MSGQAPIVRGAGRLGEGAAMMLTTPSEVTESYESLSQLRELEQYRWGSRLRSSRMMCHRPLNF
jgi:hypothetical protein